MALTPNNHRPVFEVAVRDAEDSLTIVGLEHTDAQIIHLKQRLEKHMNIDGPVILYAGVENQKLRKINDDRVVSEQVNQGFSLYWDTAKDPKLCDRVENDHSVANKVGDSAVQRLVIAVKETCTSVATKAAISNNEANGTGNQVIAVTNTELANLNDILASPWKCVIL